MKSGLWMPLLLIGLVLIGCEKGVPAQRNLAVTNAAATAFVPGWPPTKAQPRLASTKLYVGPEEITAELAVTRLQIMTGMMFRTNMLEMEGMLFAFPNVEQRAFYMKNTRVPLTLAYIDPEGTILELHDLKPLDETPVFSKSDQIQYVLEMNQGWFARHNISTGAVVATEKGPLKEFFRLRR